MGVKDVTTLGDPVLRAVASDFPNADCDTGNLQTVIEDMVDTMREKDGVGIAAPQIGLSVRIFAIEVRDVDRYRHAKLYPLNILINPVLEISENAGMVHSWEGCLSVPGLRGRLPRAQRVRLTGMNEKLETTILELEGFPAIVAQHEADHLEGRVYLDGMEDLMTLCFEEHYKAYVRDSGLRVVGDSDNVS